MVSKGNSWINPNEIFEKIRRKFLRISKKKLEGNSRRTPEGFIGEFRDGFLRIPEGFFEEFRSKFLDNFRRNS